MAVANFFDKAAMGAAQILNGVDTQTLTSRLNGITVGVAFDSAAVASSEGRLTLELTVNLLSRFYPRLHLRALDLVAGEHLDCLKAIGFAINPAIEFVDEPVEVTITLVVGRTPIPAGPPTMHLGSDNWIARLSKNTPVGSTDSGNPFGAGAAACVGVANVFRHVFRDTLEKAELDDELTLSMFDFAVNADALANPKIAGIDVGELHLVGLGAIGYAAVSALARTKYVDGVLQLIDHERVDLTNLQRYALAVQTDVGAYKVDRAAAEFAGSRIQPVPHRQKWGEYQREHQRWNLERVAVAVDNAEDRRAVQASLPRRVTNSWTQAGDVGISRHYLFGEEPCLVCLYFPEEGAMHLDQMVAAAIGLPETNSEIRVLLHNNAPVGRGMIERISTALNVPVEPLLRFADRSLHSFYVEAICSGMIIKLGGTIGGQVEAAEVPMAFQSMMAGIMLAAELVADAGELRQGRLATTSRIDLLHPIRGYVNRPEVRNTLGRCICHDTDYLEAFSAIVDPVSMSVMSGASQ